MLKKIIYRLIFKRAGFFLIAVGLMLGCSAGKKPVKNFKNLPESVPTMINPEKDENQIYKELKELHTFDEGSYKIGPGDIFSIYLYDETDLATESAIVKPDGSISIKLIGEVNIKSLNISKAQELVEEKYKKYLKFPKVTLLPKELKSARFLILGKITKPGKFALEHDMRILDAIALAGGFTVGVFQNNTVEMADLEHSFISRKGRLLPVDFQELVKKGNLAHNIPLHDGDYIYITSSANKEVYVLGEINSPGFFAYTENMTLLQLLTKAGGLTNFASSQIVIIRDGLVHPTIYSYNVNDILRGETRDVRIHPDDILYVTKSFLGTWNQMVKLVIPAMQSIQSAVLMQDVLE